MCPTSSVPARCATRWWRAAVKAWRRDGTTGGGTPTRCHAVMGRQVGAVHASFPVFHPVLRSLPWTVSLSPHATCSSRAQDHARRPVRPSYHEMAWPATSVRANRPPYSRGGPPRREARCLRVSACRCGLVRCPFPATKEPFQRVFYCTIETPCLACGGMHDPQHATKGCQGPALPPSGLASCSMAVHVVLGAT